MSCPAQDGGLSKSIKYYILCLAYARSGGDALTWDEFMVHSVNRPLDSAKEGFRHVVLPAPHVTGSL